MFLDKNEIKITSQYLENGYIIQPVADIEALEWMRNKFVEIVSEYLGITDIKEPEKLLNYIHENVEVKELNQFRLKVIRSFNSASEFREMYYRVARPYLEILVGNELAMQLRVNLSIQFPNDDSTILPVHADTWSGDSPFEVVVWLPIVNCYGTKAMYLLPPKR
jgi:sporadic carbohydrate cluster 2OG-Fe(II) oxygenase